MAATPLISRKNSLRPCVRHFSHSHPLRPVDVKEEEEIICSGCELDLSGSAYKCTKSICDFFLHKSCFELPRELEHPSHPQHLLVLLSSPPCDDSKFTCNACADYGTSFAYHCTTCHFNLHVGNAQSSPVMSAGKKFLRPAGSTTVQIAIMALTFIALPRLSVEEMPKRSSRSCLKIRSCCYLQLAQRFYWYDFHEECNTCHPPGPPPALSRAVDLIYAICPSTHVDHCNEIVEEKIW
ncbi:hypothetical protein SADUNF_Sadunf16G0123800 [Salix dunnii]|uniref:DC1 domain-containing protein n=1 Tax=Salix dunnii TaxID=1413687 RepID=A0A835MGS6_9ROSI|nr:hypothetical protein SADUNF_Sadunf16G0123800 [Salix dunnii]